MTKIDYVTSYSATPDSPDQDPVHFTLYKGDMDGNSKPDLIFVKKELIEDANPELNLKETAYFLADTEATEITAFTYRGNGPYELTVTANDTAHVLAPLPKLSYTELRNHKADCPSAANNHLKPNCNDLVWQGAAALSIKKPDVIYSVAAIEISLELSRPANAGNNSEGLPKILNAEGEPKIKIVNLADPRDVKMVRATQFFEQYVAFSLDNQK